MQKFALFNVYIMDTTLFSFPVKLTVSLAPPHAWDYIRVKISNLYYNLDSQSLTAEVTCQYQCSGDNYAGIESLSVPAMVLYKGKMYRVTTIGHGAFAYCRSLTAVALPQVLTTIGAYAFYYCSNLRAVTIAEGVTNIGDGAFALCCNLASLTCLAVKPPVGKMFVFGCVNCAQVTLFVPQKAEKAYAAAKPWRDFHICS